MAAKVSWFVIVNPTSGNGSGLRKWPAIKTQLTAHGISFDYALTEHKLHSVNLVQDAVNQGFKKIACVGGDGTIHNVINGIMKQTSCASSDIHLGVIPVGTGNDWIKTHGIPNHIDSAIQCLKNGQLKTQDIGYIEFLSEDKSVVYFNNLAGIGFDAHVVKRIENIKYLGAIAYIIGAILGLFSAKKFQANVLFNNETVTPNALMVLVGLCQFSGGGMQLTKKPEVRDGLFDISITDNFGRFDIVKNLLKLFNGKATYSKKIQCYKTSSITIDIKNEDVMPYIQADGELVGRGSFKATVVPNALSFYA